MEESHIVWLKHHGVEPEFLMQAVLNGFEIHHLDGDHDNNDPLNLVLIYDKDHYQLHGIYHDTKLNRTWQDVLAEQKAKITKGQIAYNLRTSGAKWAEVATQVSASIPNTMTMARRYAKLNSLAWPPTPRG